MAPVTGLAAQFAALPAHGADPASPGWPTLLADFIATPAWTRLCAFVDGERAAGRTLYPDDNFHALRATAPDAVRVVILGQDPYHGVDKRSGIVQAHGLAFSVPEGAAPPPSLRNIYKEIAGDPAIDPRPAPPASGTLASWARQGVLLLNTVLSVEAGKAASHAGRGWEGFTDAVLRAVCAQQAAAGRRLVVMLWGSHAQAKAPLFAGHHVLCAPHPSPLSAHRGFLGCGHFSAANARLREQGLAPIDWSVPATGAGVPAQASLC